MKTLLAFLLLTASALAQCGPGGCPPQGWYQPCPQPYQQQWQPQPSVGIGGNIGGFGLGIGAGFSAPRIQPRHTPGSAIRIGDSGGYFSGVIVSADGLILTAKHCLLSGEPVYPLINGKRVECRVLYEAPETEGPVVLKVQANGLPASRISENTPRVGDPAYCIGYPANQPQAVTISGRMQPAEWSYRIGMGVSPSTPDTPGAWRASVLNAPAQGGMSGGPLFNANGEVIGLLSATGPFASRYIGLAAIRVAMQAAAQPVELPDAPVPISGGPAPLWERTPDPQPVPILEPKPEPTPIQPPIASQPPITSAEIAAELAAQIKTEPIDYQKIGAAVAENQLIGQKEVVKEVSRLGSIVDKLSVAVKAINVVAPAVGLELPWWLGAAATTGPVGIGVGAAFWGIRAFLKWRGRGKTESPSTPAPMQVARPVQSVPEQVVRHVIEQVTPPAPQPVATSPVVPPVATPPAETVVRHQVVPNAFESTPPQLVPVAVASEELKRLHEAMAHVSKTTYGAAAVQDILSAAQQLKLKVPSLA